ncbi:MAG TPA: DNA polymerase Y family protein [Beijerinckiaceae bacterium]|nr:DNA polymerase Y family protein [Beijerinckiaceae bacterium]
MRCLSLWLPYLPTDQLARRAPRLRHSSQSTASAAPLTTWTKIKGAQRLASLDARAQAAGLRAGMTLADARAIVPTLVVAEADASAEADLLAAIADWCRRFTPLAALDQPDGVLLDISGASHLFGGERALRAEIVAALAAQGLAARAALAGNPALAWALARFADIELVPAGIPERDLYKLVADLPIAALRIGAETIAALAQAGLRRIGDLLMRPRAPIAARFGTGLVARLDAILGKRGDPLSPRFETPAYLVERRFAEGIARREDIEATISGLAHELCALLERHDEGAREIDVSLFRVDGVVKHLSAGTSRPLRDPKLIARLFRERIEAAGEEGLDTGYGFDVVRLAAIKVERPAMPQSALTIGMEVNGCDHSTDLADLIDRLGARLGLRRVLRFEQQETHIPEFAVAAVPAAQTRGRSNKKSNAELSSPATANLLPARPLKLLEPPEPIEAIAAVPDSPPAKFRWRRVWHDIAAIEGPERIAPEWWKHAEPALTRDYFRAEDSLGQRFWLFREGLYTTETVEPRWFLHGLFG